ncbi:MAG: Peroxinectin (EC, partial [uncultured Thiotrichaceae bacterium]
FQGGELIMNEGYLPKDDVGFYLAGDERVNEHIGLTAMHTLWVREHNRLAQAIACEYPNWKDNRLYNEAKRVVVAELQAITYNEFLPALLGRNTLPGYWEYTNDQNPGYDDGIQANISNVFAVSAFRFGHSMLSPVLLRLDKDGDEIPQKHVPLRSAFFQPDKLEEAGIEPIFRGFASQAAQALDPMVVDDIRNFLILSPGDQQGFDLAALNIQRGRDHRLPAYNDVRESFGLRRIDSFHDPIWREGFGDKLAEAYDDPDQIDVWVGGLAEEEVGNTLTGETLQAILLEQFRRLRHGDRFWYEDQFYDEEIEELNQTTLADIIKRNTPIQKHEIQNNVFIASEIHDPVEVNATPGVTSETTRLSAPDPAEEIRRNRIMEAIRNGALG